MPWKKDEHAYVWKDLEGHIASSILHAPRTGGDGTGEWPAVHPRIIGYLMRHVVGKPWADSLALIAAVFAAQRRDVATIDQTLVALHARFASLFPLFGLDNVRQWKVDQYLVPYVQGDVLPQDSLHVRVHFGKRYMSATNLVTSWLDFLPAVQQEEYRSFLLPTINPLLAEMLYKEEKELERQRQDHRKEETEAVVPQFTDLRAQAHLRFNRMTRLWQAYQQALDQVLPDHSNLPLAFTYEEGHPPIERIHCRLWDRRSFVLHSEHAGKYHEATLRCARNKQSAFTDDLNQVFLEVIKTEQLAEDAPPEGFWFTDILKRGLLGQRARHGTEQEVREKQTWLRQWGYGEDDPKSYASPFDTHHPGLLTWPDTLDGRNTASFASQAQRRTDGTLIPVESLMAAATFGLLALELFTTTGMRINELMQVSLLPECLIRMVDDPAPLAINQTPHIRYVLRLLPKGERTEKRHHYGIGKDALRLIEQTARLLCEHYKLQPGAALPRVSFTVDSSRRHRFGEEKLPYIFQYAHQHLSDNAICACLRVLMHGMVFQTSAGDPVILKPHLLRHKLF